jgi:hypothetical protein
MDSKGNAEGGFRTPFVDVPITTYTPFDTAAHTTEFSGFCILHGYNTLFSNSVLKSLYKNHGTYVNQVTRETNDLVKQRFWLRADGAVVVNVLPAPFVEESSYRGYAIVRPPNK